MAMDSDDALTEDEEEEDINKNRNIQNLEMTIGHLRNKIHYKNYLNVKISHRICSRFVKTQLLRFCKLNSQKRYLTFLMDNINYAELQYITTNQNSTCVWENRSSLCWCSSSSRSGRRGKDCSPELQIQTGDAVEFITLLLNAKNSSSSSEGQSSSSEGQRHHDLCAPSDYDFAELFGSSGGDLQAATEAAAVIRVTEVCVHAGVVLKKVQGFYFNVLYLYF